LDETEGGQNFDDEKRGVRTRRAFPPLLSNILPSPPVVAETRLFEASTVVPVAASPYESIEAISPKAGDDRIFDYARVSGDGMQGGVTA
jgi:hypothetical protein